MDDGKREVHALNYAKLQSREMAIFFRWIFFVVCRAVLNCPYVKFLRGKDTTYPNHPPSKSGRA